MKTKIKCSILFFLMVIASSQITLSQMIYNSVYNIADDGDFLWIRMETANKRNLVVKYEKATTQWTEELDLDAWVCPNPNFGEGGNNDFIDLQRNKEGNIWLSTSACGIVKFSGNTSYNCDVSDSEHTYYNLTNFRIDPDNNKWFYGSSSALKWNENEGITDRKIIPNINNVQHPAIELSSIQIDKDEKIWFTEKYGNGAWDSNIPSWFFGYFTEDSVQTYYPQEIQLGDYGISGLVIDDANNKWLADLTYGLLKFDGTNFTVYNTQNSAIPSNNLLEIKKDNAGNIWMRSSNLLIKFDGTNFSSYGISYKYNSMDVDANGDVWLGSQALGLFKYDAKTDKIIRPAAVTGIKNVDVTDTFLTIYPNPTQDKVYIKANDNTIPQVKVFSIIGQLLLETRSNEIDLSALSKGIYLIQVNGKTTKIEKK
jgi:streptogramin lyase